VPARVGAPPLKNIRPVLFALGYFSDGVSNFAQNQPQTQNPPIYASHIVEITGGYHHARLVC
jgi:hypothetical protein